MTQDEVNEFLRESNAIEQEYSEEAFKGAQLAWNYAFRRKDNLTVPNVLKIHKILMRRREPKIAGKFRECDVWIGGKKKEFIGLFMLDAGLYDVVGAMNETMPFMFSPEKDKFCKVTHIAFEQLHPFEDGNGRVGRILYNIHRINLGLPIHIIHEGKEQTEYYEWFKQEKDNVTG